MKKYLRNALIAWLALTALVILQLAAIYFRNGMTGIYLFIQEWPLSDLTVTLEAVTFTWLSVGSLLYLLVNDKVNSKNALFTAGFFLVMLLYLNILRERFRYGDYQYYLEAATALYNNQTLPDTYLYLPLWATLLQFIAPLGDSGMLAILWAVNIIMLGLFYMLLVRVLERYEFSNHFAVIVAVLFMLVNTPLHRSLGYVQVNIMVMVLIMSSMLTFPKNAFLSALTLALAVHLKVSPAALVLAFLLERNWKWMFYFALTFILIALIPIALEGTRPYFDYINNINILTHITDNNFHDTSFDSFFRFLNPFFGIKIEITRLITMGAKAALGLSALYVMWQNVRQQTFIKFDSDGGRVGSSSHWWSSSREAAYRDHHLFNALPSLFIVMTLTSPIVWDHHGLFLALSFLLLLKVIEAPALWMWFAFAYFLEFILPSFDFFPWSFGRLLAPLIILFITWCITRREQILTILPAANRWAEKIF
jgi:hypothetical protein